MAVTPNTLAVLVPAIIAALQRVLRNTGAILNATTADASATPAALNQTVNLPGTAAASAYDVEPGATPPALVGTTPTAKVLTIEKYRGARFSLTGEDWQALAARGPDFRMTQVDECIATLVDEVCAYVWGKLDVGAGYALGAAGTNPFASNPNILMDAWEIQSRVKVPSTGRIGVVGTLDWAAAGKLAQFQKLNEAPMGVDFATARMGMLANYGMQWDQNIGRHTPVGNGAAYVLDGAVLVGATTFVVKTGTGDFLAGDVVHFGTDTSIKYVVASWASATKTVTLNSKVLTAASDGDAVTIAAAHRGSMLVHPDNCVLAIRPPAEAPDGDGATSVTIIRDPVTGVALRLANYKGYHAGQWELSLVYGAKVRRPDLALKLLG